MNIRDAFIISDVLEHKDLKQKILEAIKEIGVHSSIIKANSLFNTDWELNPNYPRPYFPIVKQLFEEQNKKICGVYNFDGCDTIGITQNFWFQQYAFGDFHHWHLHSGGCTYSSVYYVDLPKGSSKTTFRFLNDEFEIDVKEGQILSTPSMLLHCSKPNKSKEIKTVIAFNTNIEVRS
jgi:cupin superfamily acireductone dioxygenase involved in methionine salvage